jgi:hypothetical protein
VSPLRRANHHDNTRLIELNPAQKHTMPAPDISNGTNGASGTNGTNGHTHENGTRDGSGDHSHTNGRGHATNGHASHVVEGNHVTEVHTNGANHEQQTTENSIHPPFEAPAMPIAICGMALRLPGGLASPQEFWEFLLNKGDARGRVPESRYNVSAYHTGSKRPGAVASEYGYFLDESIKLGSLDTSRFSLSRAELEFADPQQRRLLEVVREAFDDAGDVNFRVRALSRREMACSVC